MAEDIEVQILKRCRMQHWKVAVAESCTGGLVAARLTGIRGASSLFDRGFITYSNQAKMDMLDVPERLLETYGAVSEAVAMSMAEGALRHSLADWSLSITGIAGPGGGSTEKPVGLVFFGLAGKGVSPTCARQCFKGDREQVRLKAVQYGLEYLYQALSNSPCKI